MPTKAQIAANRRNAQNSTGPRTPAGKAASRFNALKYGIDAKEMLMFNETEEELTYLADEYREQYAPANATQRFLVDTLVANEWRLRRMRRIEAGIWERESQIILMRRHKADLFNDTTGEGVTSWVTREETFVVAAKSFLHLQRIVDACERNLHRALKELVRLQSMPSQAAESTPQPEQSIPTSPIPQNQPNSPQPALVTPPFTTPYITEIRRPGVPASFARLARKRKALIDNLAAPAEVLRPPQ